MKLFHALDNIDNIISIPFPELLWKDGGAEFYGYRTVQVFKSGKKKCYGKWYFPDRDKGFIHMIKEDAGVQIKVFMLLDKQWGVGDFEFPKISVSEEQMQYIKSLV